MFRRWLCCAAAVLTISQSLFAGDWAQYMGPNSNGISPEKGLMRQWPEGGPKVLWTTKLGEGYGAAAIQDGKVYIVDRVASKQDVLRCLDLTSGKEEWTFSYDAPGDLSHNGSRAVPTVTPNHIYIIGPFGDIHCIDKTTHKPVWKKQILKDFGGAIPRWGVAQSPLLYKDTLIVAPQSNTVGMAGLDAATGSEKWRSAQIGRMAYGSPMLINIAGVDQAVIVTNDGAAAVSPQDGKVLWKYAHPCKIPVPNVTDLGNGKLFVTAGYNAGSAIIQVSNNGGTWAVKELSKSPVGGHCHPGIAYQDHIYILCNTNERADGMVCFTPDGTIAWQTRRDPYLCKGGSILTGNGLMYVMDGEKGELHIIEPSPAGFKSLSKAKLMSGKEIWAPLALSDGKLVIRDQSQMKCVDVRAQ